MLQGKSLQFHCSLPNILEMYCLSGACGVEVQNEIRHGWLSRKKVEQNQHKCFPPGCMFLNKYIGSCRCSGVVTGVGDADPYRWPNSKWRSLVVSWVSNLSVQAAIRYMSNDMLVIHDTCRFVGMAWLITRNAFLHGTSTRHLVMHLRASSPSPQWRGSG